jgi:quercetin dioxygenase-like cupin family protein
VQVDGSGGVLLPPGAGEAVTEEEARTVLLKTANPLLDVTWSRYEAGERGPDPHVHERHVDAFFVLSGELLFELGGDGERRVAAPAGTLLAVPPGVVHTFGNEAGGTATFLNLHAPSCGFADSLRGDASGFDSADPPEGGGRDPAGAVACPVEGGEAYGRGDVVTRILLELPELSVLGFECGPRFAVAPHTHDDHLDSFFVLAGEARFTLGDRDELAPQGTWVAAPPGVLHGVRNGDAPRAHFLNVHAPDAGFAASIRRRYS